MYGKFDVIYSSPLFRAKQTANLIKQELKFNNVFMPALIIIVLLM